MTRLAVQHQAVNLAQGFTDEAPLFELVWGGIAATLGGDDEQIERFDGLTVQEIMQEAGASADDFMQMPLRDVLASLQSARDRFNQYSYPFGLEPRYITLREDPDNATWNMDRDELRAAAGPGPRAIVLNTPHNPAGKVFSEGDLSFIAELCRERDLLAFTDEIYEHIVYDGHRHRCLAGFEGIRERTFVVNSISKTGGATGWRVGWVISPADYTTRIRATHDTLVIQAPTPLQKGAVRLLHQDAAVFRELGQAYETKQRALATALRGVGFRVSPPQGSYYLFANYRQVDALKAMSPVDAAMFLIKEVGVASVPGDNFYRSGNEGDDYLRFAFCRSLESLQEAERRLTEHLT